MFLEEMKEKGGISFIEIQADEDTTRERLKMHRLYSEADFEIYKLIRGQNEPLDEAHLILKSTDNNLNEMIQKATEYLKANNDNRTNQ
jgi:hypothetical protein